MTIKLQGMYGQQNAKAVKDLKIGDTVMWNFGYTSKVVDLIPSKTGKMIDVILQDSYNNGNPYPRRMGATRLVAVA